MKKEIVLSLHFRLDEFEHRSLRELAETDDRSINQFVRRLVKKRLQTTTKKHKKPVDTEIQDC